MLLEKQGAGVEETSVWTESSPNTQPHIEKQQQRKLRQHQ